MRWMLLAVALVVTGAMPAHAQRVYGSRTPMHRATYPTQGRSPVKLAGISHQDEIVVEEAGCTSCSSGRGGCSSCERCPCPPLLPNLLDNVADLFVRLKPCPSKCSPCVRKVHCCPYPKTMPPSRCCQPRLPRLLDSIFVCNKGCCKKSCHSGCVSQAPAAVGCSSCTAGAFSEELPGELISPPAPMPEMNETPFKDDPAPPQSEEAKRPTNTKTAGTPGHWYKTSRRAPVRTAYDDSPDTIVIGNASPIMLRE